MAVYYNESDLYAAGWLRELIKAGHIAPGDVDERSIEDVKPEDLSGYTQCHFFAGIGTWSYALRRAGWSDDRPVWTGSCPCQPFSSAGKRRGTADRRHLWPEFFRLIQKCRPVVVLGEQVASRDGLGWFDLVSADLEGEGYAVGAVDTCAAGFGAPHIRQRLYWMADADGKQLQRRWFPKERGGVELADSGTIGRVGNAGGEGLEGHARYGYSTGRWAQSVGHASPPGGVGCGMPTNSVWRDADWLLCRDGRWRPVESGAFPLAHGVANRVGRLRGYGNAIVAPQAEAFVRACMEALRHGQVERMRRR